MSITWYQGVAVGVDGSDESLTVLDWAARAADLHEVPLTVVATHAVPAMPVPGFAGSIRDAWEESDRAARAARTQLGSRRPGGQDVEHIVLPGVAAHVLSQRSTTCDLVVVGNRGLSVLDRVLLGSTSSALAASAPGTVVVVPTGVTALDPRRIRVGVGRDDEPDVLGAAFAEADARGCPLEVLHVTGTEPTTPALPELDPVAASWREADRADLADRVARWSEKYPRVSCTVVIRRGDPAAAVLQDLTADDLVILGGRRHPPVMGRMLRSVPDAVLRAAPCPVLVVHAERLRADSGRASTTSGRD
jgi:nucleotide-binding universal stress UspA family protein